MNWEEIYKSKLVSAEEAVSHIKSGDRVVVGHAAGTTELLLKTMVDHKERYRNVEIAHQVRDRQQTGEHQRDHPGRVLPVNQP